MMKQFNIPDDQVMNDIANKPGIIAGGIFTDQRGTISFVNDFTLDETKRFYTIQPADLNPVRAWQGHKKEEKWFYVVSGCFKVITVKIDNWEAPSDQCEIHEFDLRADTPAILHIPGGYANGFKALQPDSQVIIFSNFAVQQSAGDDYRYDQNRWFNWEILQQTR
jgi:dTDP-4-dehydrorhamnose 3,5-epimerase